MIAVLSTVARSRSGDRWRMLDDAGKNSNRIRKSDIMLVARNGVATGSEDFAPIRPQLVRIAKRAFPDDEVVESLSVNR